MPELVLAFKKYTENNLESFVQWCAGPMVHCDILTGRDGLMFTSYMFERFSVNRVLVYPPETHVCLSVPVSDEEHSAACEMLGRLVDRQIPYNYSDVFRMVFPSPLPLGDVACEADIQTLFCSQAITLVLRMCLDPSHRLAPVLAKLNSRTTTPSMLYDAVLPHCESVPCI